MSLLHLCPRRLQQCVHQDQAAQSRWGWVRQRGAKLLAENFRGHELITFDSMMGFIITLNAVTLIVETDFRSNCARDKNSNDCVPAVIGVLNVTFLLIYTTESSFRLFVQRLGFWCNFWNLLDVVIIVSGWLDWVAPSDDLPTQKLSLFRLCRLMRVIRLVKVLRRFQMLTNMIRGFTGAMRAMLCGICLVLVLLVMWSILAVEIINPINQNLKPKDEYCLKAFTTVLRTTLYFFQTLVAGDSWGLCTIPIINAEPLTYPMFALALVSVQLGFMNLVLAVIVDKAAEAREGDKEEQLLQKKREEVESIAKWKYTMEALDADGSGTITEKELLEGYNNPAVKNMLGHMHLSEEDLSKLFRVMDCDDSGHLGYSEFVDAFHQAQIQDPAIYMMIVKLTVEKIEHKIESVVNKGLKEIAEAITHLDTSPVKLKPVSFRESEAPAQVAVAMGLPARVSAATNAPAQGPVVSEDPPAMPDEETKTPLSTTSLGCGVQRYGQRSAPPPLEPEALALQLSTMQTKIEARLDSLTAEAWEDGPPESRRPPPSSRASDAPLRPARPGALLRRAHRPAASPASSEVGTTPTAEGREAFPDIGPAESSDLMRARV